MTPFLFYLFFSAILIFIWLVVLKLAKNQKILMSEIKKLQLAIDCLERDVCGNYVSMFDYYLEFLEYKKNNEKKKN